MPPLRTLSLQQYRLDPSVKKSSRKYRNELIDIAIGDNAEDLAKCDMFYPVDKKVRHTFRTKEGKIPTAHQWAVYDLVRQIPPGKVTTYKEICSALGEGSPRSVGTALRTNPFAPFVPCHRVIASNRFIGGFCGEWEKGGKCGGQMQKKLLMLAREGVGFDEKGYLIRSDKIWHPNDGDVASI